MGMTPEDIAAFLAADGEGDVLEVHDDNWQALEVFQACATQWRWIVGMSAQRVGMDYPSLESVLRLMAIPRKAWRGLFADLQIMEEAALQVFTERAKR